jgi:hypothetical protein
MGQDTDLLLPGGVTMAVSRLFSTYRNVVLLLVAFGFAAGGGSQLGLGTSGISVRSSDRDIVHGVLFEQPCAVAVEDGVLGKCGDIVNTKQPR